jgi:hypothetical protein
VLQFNSDFNGAYYYQDNSSLNASFKARPYYIVCMGPEDALRKLFSYVGDRFGPKGYRNFLFLTPRESYDVHPAVVMNTSYYNYEPDKPMIVTGAQRSGSDNKFRIKLKADFSELPVAESYLTDVSNYEVAPGYAVESVRAVRDGNGGATHEIILAAPAPKQETVRLELKTKLPNWVGTSNLDADKGMTPEALEGRTFGIRYLIDGMYDAYYARESSPRYFAFAITVKN